MRFNFILISISFVLSIYSAAAQNNPEQVLDSLLDLANRKTLPFVVNETVSVEAYRNSVGSVNSFKYADELQKMYTGQDMPMLIQNTPSVISYTDGGNFNGYGYFRLRGIDQTRVNISLNGVPLSEPEDQGAYFSNYTDLTNNLEDIQITRGANITSNGTAAFAGSLNMQSPHILQNTALGHLQLGFGSFDAYKISAAYNSGLLPNRFAYYGRFSTNVNKGYREHSGNNSNSFFMSAAYVPNINHTFKLTAFRGNAKNQLAYLATNFRDIQTNPKTNYLSENERDDFTQHFAQLLHTWQGKKNNNRWNEDKSSSINGNNSLYYINIDGNYDILSLPTMLNLNLKSHQFGLFTNLTYTYNFNRNPIINSIKLIGGIHANHFFRHHFLVAKPFIRPQDAFYFNTGFKSEASSFLSAYAVGLDKKLRFQTDLQLRGANFSYRPDVDYQQKTVGKNWVFFNYKMGAEYQIHQYIVSSLSLAACRREPTRTDLLGNYDDLDSTLLLSLGNFSRVRPEQVVDIEWNNYLTLYKNVYLRATFYFMNFRNEIAATGQLNSFGIPLRQNVDKSYRAGAELTLTANLRNYKLNFELNAAYNYHRIQAYTTAFNGQTYTNVRPLLTPDWQGYLTCRYQIVKKVELLLQARLVGESFLSNENDTRLKLPAYFVPDFRINYSPKAGHNLGLSLNNLSNKPYFSAGYANGTEAAYFVQAPFNFFLIYNLYF